MGAGFDSQTPHHLPLARCTEHRGPNATAAGSNPAGEARAPLAQWESCRLLSGVSGVRSPHGVLAEWRSSVVLAGLISRRPRVQIPPPQRSGGSAGRAPPRHGGGPWFDPRSEHSPRVRLWVGRGPFKPAERVRVPARATTVTGRSACLCRGLGDPGRPPARWRPSWRSGRGRPGRRWRCANARAPAPA
jgi:hypothetical protein